MGKWTSSTFRTMGPEDDIFQSDAEMLVNPVNCEGVAGRGLALEFKKRFPVSFDYYRMRCLSSQGWEIGDVQTYAENGKIVAYFPTKSLWRNPSSLSFVEQGMKALVREIRECGVRSVAIPALGCGLGGLRWDVVLPVIGQAIEEINIEQGLRVYVYPPKES